MERDHVKEACVTRLPPPPPSLCSSAGITVFCTFNFLCLNLTRRFCFRFPLYQTEYDNVTWELRDEKISMVPSAFFFFFALLFFFCWGDELNRRRRVWNQYSMHYNEIIFFFFFHSEKLGFENGVCKPNWIRNGGYFVRYLSNFTVCVSAVEFVWVCATNLLECCRFRALNKCILLHLLSSQLATLRTLSWQPWNQSDTSGWPRNGLLNATIQSLCAFNKAVTHSLLSEIKNSLFLTHYLWIHLYNLIFQREYNFLSCYTKM